MNCDIAHVARDLPSTTLVLRMAVIAVSMLALLFKYDCMPVTSDSVAVLKAFDNACAVAVFLIGLVIIVVIPFS